MRRLRIRLHSKLSFFICLAAVIFARAVYTTENTLTEPVKEAIAKKQQEVSFARDADRGPLLKQLAVLYLQDQDQERAFETFINALATARLSAQVKSNVCPGVDRYEEALLFYLDPRSGTPQEVAAQILDKFASNALGPLGYLVALSYANLGKYSDFFELFYHTYLNYPENYLANKTHAILYIKLFERAQTVEKRETFRKLIASHLLGAEAKEPRDISLYKLQIAFCSSEEKAEIVLRCLNKIIEGNIIIPRSEIQFYVQHAVDSRQKDLAQKFVNKARQWHQSSRIIDTAQKFLDSSP
jgi:hypothetical protein